MTVFRPYLFEIGEKIRIEAGPRQGDWLVVDLGEQKVTLECPISHKKFAWERFSYLSPQVEDRVWPAEH